MFNLCSNWFRSIQAVSMWECHRIHCHVFAAHGSDICRKRIKSGTYAEMKRLSNRYVSICFQMILNGVVFVVFSICVEWIIMNGIENSKCERCDDLLLIAFHLTLSFSKYRLWSSSNSLIRIGADLLMLGNDEIVFVYIQYFLLRCCSPIQNLNQCTFLMNTNRDLDCYLKCAAVPKISYTTSAVYISIYIPRVAKTHAPFRVLCAPTQANKSIYWYRFWNA